MSCRPYAVMSLPAAVRMEEANVRQVRDDYLRLGHVTRAEIDQHLDVLATGRPGRGLALLASAWG